MDDVLGPREESVGTLPSALETEQKHWNELARRLPWALPFLERLQESGISEVQIESARDDSSAWFVTASLPVTLQERYALAPAVLILVREGATAGRDLWAAHEHLLRKQLDLDLIIVVDDAPELARRLRLLPGPWGQRIPWQPGPPMASLEQQFARYCADFNLFDLRLPARGRQVVGRDALIDDLSGRLARGHSVGLFGLRKVGKTSVMRAITDRLDPDSAFMPLSVSEQPLDSMHAVSCDVLAVHVDVQGVVDRSVEGFLRQLHRSIRRRFALADIESPSWKGTDPLREIEALLGVAEDYRNLLCIAIDEYDLLFQDHFTGIGGLFNLFRAFSQRTGLLSLALIGRDSEYCMRPEMDGEQNPLLGWIAIHWLHGLNHDDAKRLLTDLGHRMGLDFMDSIAEAAWVLTRGHPLLHRQYGSMLYEDYIQRGIEPPRTFDLATLQSFADRDVVSETCSEILHLLTTRYPGTPALLAALAKAPSMPGQIIEKHGGWRGDAARALRNFGILTGSAEHPDAPRLLASFAQSSAAT